MSTTLRGSRLIENCTPSISYDRQVQSACAAFDEQMYEIIDETGVVIMIPSILQIDDSNLIDILAWQFHVDFYDATQPLDFRRQLVQNSIQWHMRKGTVALVEEVINTYWPGGATLDEWYEYKSPLPPNYPTVNVDTQIGFVPTTAINVSANTITLNAHGLTNGQQVRWVLGSLAIGGRLPTPFVGGVYYFVYGATTNTFQLAPSSGGSVIDILDVGVGNSNAIWKRGIGDWHDRYRFRIFVDQAVIPPADEQKVLELISRYKPISRWCEAIIYARVSQCNIVWAGGMLRFIYRTSEKPRNYP